MTVTRLDMRRAVLDNGTAAQLWTSNGDFAVKWINVKRINSWLGVWSVCVVYSLIAGGCQTKTAVDAATSDDGVQAPATQTTADEPRSQNDGKQDREEQPAAVADLSSAVTLNADELADGWISLFDGVTLFGWKHNNQADWRVENGAIVVSQGEPGLLVTTSDFGDYVLKLQFRCAADTNSGVFLETQIDPGDVASKCYELNIAGMDNPFPTGSLVNRQAVTEDLHRDDWQTYEVTVDQGHIVVHLDGKQVLDYTDPHPVPRGRIGLQLNHGAIAFRDIKLKPLGMASLFNGKDLEGWKTYPEMPSKFTVQPDDATLHVVNGRGQLETEESYDDFVMQLECITHAAGLNSGIFFRCIPGEQMNGYECQINNSYKNDDRSQPADCGTGGFFRRQDARRVVADDLNWFYMTILADGPHMAAWVNGLQVSDWTDTRPPDPNPRKGLRLESGTIMIQGHDPTTDLSFRNLRIAELPK